MTLYGVSGSLVLSGLFFASSLASPPPCASTGSGDSASAAAAAMNGVATRNCRRLTYSAFGVTSLHLRSAPFRISMLPPRRDYGSIIQLDVPGGEYRFRVGSAHGPNPS